MSKRVLQQALAAIMGASVIGDYYSSGGCSNASSGRCFDKQFKRKKNRRKIAKASQKKNRRAK